MIYSPSRFQNEIFRGLNDRFESFQFSRIFLRCRRSCNLTWKISDLKNKIVKLPISLVEKHSPPLCTLQRFVKRGGGGGGDGGWNTRFVWTDFLLKMKNRSGADLYPAHVYIHCRKLWIFFFFFEGCGGGETSVAKYF